MKDALLLFCIPDKERLVDQAAINLKGDKNRTAVDKRNKPCYNKKYVWPSRILRISGLI